MDRRNTLLASLGLALAFGATALLSAAPLQSGTGGTQGGTKTGGDKHAGHDHSKDGKERKERKSEGGATVGQKAPDFQFTDLNGKSHSLTEFAGKTVILEWMNPGCPVCKEKVESGAVSKMMTRVREIDPTAVFIFVNSTNPEMGGSNDVTAKYLKDNKIDAIAFWEAQGTVGRLYGAQTTPHLFVIDKSGNLAYSGAIDDDKASEKKGVNYVVDAVKALKDGKTPSPASTKPYGCSVKYPKNQKS